MGILKRIFCSERDAGYEKGIEYYNSHKYPEAIAHFEKVLRGDTACSSLHRNLARFYCAQAHRNLGIVRYATGNFIGSLSEFRMALDLNKEHVDLYYFMGICHNNLQNYDEAVGAFNRLLEIDPNHLSTKLKLAITLHNLHMWDKAANIYQKILINNPNFADVHYHLGLALLGQGQAEKAEKSFQAARSINPDYLDARVKLGITQTYLGKFDEAINGLSALSKKHPGYPDLHYYISIIHTGRNEILQAIDRLKQALKINPGYRDARIKLALIYCREAEFQSALREIEELCRISPEDKNIETAKRAINATISGPQKSAEEVFKDLIPLMGNDKPLVQIISDFNKSVDITLNFSEMVSLIEKHATTNQEEGLWEMLLPLTLDYIKQHPDYADLYNTLGSLCLKLNKIDEAADAFSQAVRINPNYIKARTNLFKTLKIQSNFGEALEHGRYLAEVNRVKYPDVFFAIGEIYLTLGKPKAALEKAGEALKLRQHYPPAIFLTAQAYEKLNQKKNAIDAYRAYMEITPNSHHHSQAMEAIKKLETP